MKLYEEWAYRQGDSPGFKKVSLAKDQEMQASRRWRRGSSVAGEYVEVWWCYLRLVCMYSCSTVGSNSIDGWKKLCRF
jgi:hypothetical protein